LYCQKQHFIKRNKVRNFYCGWENFAQNKWWLSKQHHKHWFPGKEYDLCWWGSELKDNMHSTILSVMMYILSALGTAGIDKCLVAKHWKTIRCSETKFSQLFCTKHGKIIAHVFTTVLHKTWNYNRPNALSKNLHTVFGSCFYTEQQNIFPVLAMNR
jgi:hypothetical protein